MERIYVIGAGSWGTAFAHHLARKGHEVNLWVREEKVLKEIQNKGENSTFLPGIKLPPGIKPFSDLSLLEPSGIYFVAIPSKFVRGVLRNFPVRPEFTVSLTKGIEEETLAPMSQVFREELGKLDYAVLSGPSFALEVAQGSPTVVVVASRNREFARKIQSLVSDEHLRAYTSEDVLGVELCAAVKNVLAIAAGAVSGLGFGHNTLAALIVRGIAEMRRFVVSMGGQPETVAGIAGVGDLVLTTTGALSRNRRVGYELGRGRKLDEILKDMKMVAEGITTSRAVLSLARKLGVEMPITEKVVEVLWEGKPPSRAVKELMLRRLKSEFWG